MAKSVIIVSATSGMARAAADSFAARGYALVLAARDAEENGRIAQDIRTRHGVQATTLHFDAEAFDTHAALLDEAAGALGGLPEGLVFFTGYMADQRAAEKDFALAHRMIEVNFSAAVSLIEAFAARCEARRSGFIGIVSSAAGDRGKQSNYLYGATKAALTVYAQGLRNRLFPAGVTVTTIKPGFVDTKMTFGMKLPPALTASPEQAGEAICRAVLAGKHEVYVLWFWRWIMTIIRAIPEWQFKKMKM
jgi:decaprenylphospho-beta-D-erythro-pentofuranosid-2-ulose 2-reductase